MKTEVFLRALSMALIFTTACSKSDNGPDSDVCGYAPYSTGSTFTYELISKTDPFAQLGDTSTTVMTVTGTREYQDKVWSVVDGFALNDPGTQPEESLFRCDGDGVYFALESGNTLGGLSIDALQLQLLQFPAETGTNWEGGSLSTEDQGISWTNTYNYEIVETGLTVELNGQTFTNVVKVQESLNTVTFAPGFPPFEQQSIGFARFFSPAAGLVRSLYIESDFLGNQDTLVQQNLMEYEIK